MKNYMTNNGEINLKEIKKFFDVFKSIETDLIKIN